MELLTTLGVNHTIFYQFALFLISFLFLYFLVFKPYYAAHVERIQRTSGAEGMAEQLTEETDTLERQYELKARQINEDMKVVFDRERTLALREYDRVVGEAREKARTNLEKNRRTIAEEVRKAQQTLEETTPEIANVIVEQMLGGGK